MSRKVLKYKSLKALLDAYKKGELTEPLRITSDDCYVSIDGVGRLYENDPVGLLRAALQLLGVPTK